MTPLLDMPGNALERGGITLECLRFIFKGLALLRLWHATVATGGRDERTVTLFDDGRHLPMCAYSGCR